MWPYSAQALPAYSHKGSRTTTAIDMRVVSLNHRAPTQLGETTGKHRPHANPTRRAMLAWRRAPDVDHLLSVGGVEWRRDHHSTELNTTSVRLTEPNFWYFVQKTWCKFIKFRFDIVSFHSKQRKRSLHPEEAEESSTTHWSEMKWNWTSSKKIKKIKLICSG